MNPVVDIFTNLSDEDLIQAVKEIKEDNELGIIRADGILRKCAAQVAEITQSNISIVLFLSETNLLREAAFRWINKIK